MLAVRVRCIKFHVKSRSTERLLQFMRFSEFIAQNKKEVVISREAFRCSATNRHPHSRLRHLQRDGTKKSTSNHNFNAFASKKICCCVLSNFYIKPQLRFGLSARCVWFTYQIFVSNHNLGSIKDRIPVTYSGIPLKKSFLSYRRSSLNEVFANSDGQMYQKNSNC